MRTGEQRPSRWASCSRRCVRRWGSEHGTAAAGADGRGRSGHRAGHVAARRRLGRRRRRRGGRRARAPPSTPGSPCSTPRTSTATAGRRCGSARRWPRGPTVPFVATKAGRRADPFDAAQYTPENLRAWIDRSRRNLGVETLDLVQLHCPPPATYEDDRVYDTLDALVDRGGDRRLRRLGRDGGRGAAAIERPGVQSLQVILNIFRRKPLEELLPAAAKAGVGVLARVPLASGLLTGKYDESTTFPRRRPPELQPARRGLRRRRDLRRRALRGRRGGRPRGRRDRRRRACPRRRSRCAGSSTSPASPPSSPAPATSSRSAATSPPPTSRP